MKNKMYIAIKFAGPAGGGDFQLPLSNPLFGWAARWPSGPSWSEGTRPVTLAEAAGSACPLQACMGPLALSKLVWVRLPPPSLFGSACPLQASFGYACPLQACLGPLALSKLVLGPLALSKLVWVRLPSPS